MLRRIDLHIDNQRALVQGLNSANPARLPDFPQSDTLELAIHQLTPNPEVPRRTVFVERPWSFTTIRASIGMIDAAPESGTFKLRRISAGAPLTAVLTWPADLSTAALISAWKAAVVSALNNTVPGGSGGNVFVLSDPPDTPANFIYLTSLSATDEILLEMVDNALAPLSTMETKVQRGMPGFQQLLKFVQLPIAMTDTFTFPASPVPALSEERAGAAGSNEVQLLTIPDGAVGALALGWSGANTRTMAVDALQAAQLASALNAIVIDGVTNPSFRVEARGTTTRKFAIEFIGPLAGAAQAMLGLTLHDQTPQYAATGTLPLTSPRFERALNGAASVKLKFELVIVDSGGEATIIREVTFVNDMTDGGTAQSVEEAEAVLIREVTVYIENTPLPFVEASPGFEFTPDAALPIGNLLGVVHGLNTRHPAVRVSRMLQLSPEEWEPVDDDHFTVLVGTANAFSISFDFELVDDLSNPADYRNVRIFVTSPDQSIVTFQHEHLWTQLRESLPAGQTLAVKLAAIDAAIGIVGGSLTINAANIVGLIKATQIDLTSLASGLTGNAGFLTTIKTLITNEEVVRALLTKLNETSFSEFIDLLKTSVADSAFLETLSTSLSSSAAFFNELRTLVTEILTSTQPTGVYLLFRRIPDFTLTVPRPILIPGPTTVRTVPIEEETTSVIGDTTTKSKTVRQVEERVQTQVQIFAPLSYAYLHTGDLLDIGGVLPAAGTLNKAYTVNAPAEAPAAAGRDRVTFAVGETIGFFGQHWQRVRADDTVENFHWPVEADAVLFTVAVNSTQLAPGTRWNIQFTPTLQLEGNATGRIAILVEQAIASEVGTGLANLVWLTGSGSVSGELPVVLTSAPTSHAFSVQIDRALNGSLTGTLRRHGSASSFTPAGASMVLRARVLRFDVENSPIAAAYPHVAKPVGSLTVALRGASDSIITLPEA